MTKTKLIQTANLFASLFLIANMAMAEAVVTRTSGKVEIEIGETGDWKAAKSGDTIASNQRVRTGSDGRIEIKMDAGTMRVHENSMLRLPEAVNDADQVELQEGRSLFDVLRRSGRRFEVHTPTVVVSVKGTRFGVDAGIDIGEVTVYRGTVGVREMGAAAAMETLVREGFLATGGMGVPVELDVSAATDPWQAWQDSAAMRIDRDEPIQRMNDMDRAKATLHRRDGGACDSRRQQRDVLKSPSVSKKCKISAIKPRPMRMPSPTNLEWKQARPSVGPTAETRFRPAPHFGAESTSVNTEIRSGARTNRDELRRKFNRSQGGHRSRSSRRGPSPLRRDRSEQRSKLFGFQ